LGSIIYFPIDLLFIPDCNYNNTIIINNKETINNKEIVSEFFEKKKP